MGEEDHQDEKTSKNGGDGHSTISSSSPSFSSNVSGEGGFARGTIMTLIMKIVSFGCTQWMIRYIDPETLGRVNIQLELLLTTVLFISREGFRLSLTKDVTTISSSSTTGVNNANVTTTINNNWNVAWLTIPVTTLVSGYALYLHLWIVLSPSSPYIAKGDQDYLYAGIIYCVASWIEGCAEPAVLYSLRRMDITTRVSAEGLATIVKTVAAVILLQPTTITVATSVLNFMTNSSSISAPLLSPYPATLLSIAQLLYAITYATYLYTKVRITTLLMLSRNSISPPSSTSPILQVILSNLHWPTCTLTLIFTLQGFFKHLLTESDRIVIYSISDNYNQGVYAMGSAYGGMAARIILQPLEENARLLWSKLAIATAVTSTTTTPIATTKQKSDETKDLVSSIDDNDPLEQSYTVLVKLVVLIGLVFSCVAVNYTHILLSILAGRKWSTNIQASSILSSFCVYTAFLAWNGMTEAFVYGVTTNKKDVGQLSITHTITGILFATLAPFLVSKYGTIGLIVANCLAMSIRSIYSVYFATCYFNKRQSQNRPQTRQPKHTMGQTLRRLLGTMLPHPIVWMSFIASWWVTRWSWTRVQHQHEPAVNQGSAGDLYDIELFYEEFNIREKKWLLLSMQHVLVGISCVVVIAFVIYTMEVKFRRSLVSLFRDRKMQQQEQQEKLELRPKQD